MRTLHRAAEERFGEQIHDVIEDGDYDDGYTLRHLMRLAIVENEMRNKRLDERDKARKPQSYRSAAANEHTAKLVPISRSEDPNTASSAATSRHGSEPTRSGRRNARATAPKRTWPHPSDARGEARGRALKDRK
jgi:hypothetical protein